MHTVVPANRTALPEVFSARTAAFPRGHPGLEVAAVPGDDEQRVVDSHAQPDQDAQRRADRGNAHPVGEEPDGHQAGGQRGDRDRQGQQHGQQRPECDEQHDGRAYDPDGRAETERRLQCVLHRRPPGLDLHAGCPRGLGEVDDAGDVRYGQARFRGVKDDGRVGDLN
jgi:hypothetical protein